ncbi:MAG TPA: glycosyltransferase family 39 protein [Thermomicrobiales bacterium]|nr:glycosyltransferase family 39 protein [Thermomicrobiales bacterium]
MKTTTPARWRRPGRACPAPAPTTVRAAGRGHRAIAAEVALALGVALVAAAILYVPPAWRADFRPFPDAEEYAVTARRLAQFGGYALRLLGQDYPPRYPFGFPALLTPAYWLPGATLESGLYGVVAFGALDVALTYLLSRLLYDRAAGLLAAAALLLLPPYLAWNHAIMSETATVALTAAAALLLALAARALERGARRRALVMLGALGAVGGVAILVRLTNAIPVGAAALGLLAGGGLRREWRRALPALAAGPVAALVALAVYGQRTFGSVAGTGYRYWVPEWYGSLGKTFSLRYAFVAPGATGDAAAPAGLPNLLYYARGLAGLLPDRSSLLLTVPFALLALAGMARLLADRRPAARAVGACGVATAVGLVAVYAAYFMPDVRFLAPLAPFAALGIGVAAAWGIRLLLGALRARQAAPALPRALAGAALVALALAGAVEVTGTAAEQIYLYQWYGLRNNALYQPPRDLQAIAAYQAAAPAGSVLVTDVALPLATAQGLAARYTVVPLTQGEYWDKAPLRHAPEVVFRQRILDGAFRHGVAVYTDSLTIAPVLTYGPQALARFLADNQARLVPVATTDGITIYRLAREP